MITIHSIREVRKPHPMNTRAYNLGIDRLKKMATDKLIQEIYLKKGGAE